MDEVFGKSRVGLLEPDCPLAGLLFVGPPVIKTQLVRALAEELRSGPEDFCRIGMSALAQEHYAASLAGRRPAMRGGLSDPDGSQNGQGTDLNIAMRCAAVTALDFLQDDLGMDRAVAHAYLSAPDFDVALAENLVRGGKQCARCKGS
ncbi:hypothetical protein AB0478_41900 [Streptomyces sp. NPDC051917]|uniref:hypothetical protein n=1 Tax=Streptomyces sp. NPDC051917 TaxID=3154754 RepID=UPI0034566CE9